MRVIQYFSAMVISLCYLATNAQETHTNYEFFGFSSDLRYCAFEIYAVETNDVFSTIFFIDVDKNDYSARPVNKVIEMETEDETQLISKVRQASRDEANALLTQYHINLTTKKTGALIQFKGESNGFGFTYAPEQEFMVGKEKYKLVLSTAGTGVTNGDGAEEQMVIVALEHNGQSKVLQPATKVPKSWGSVIGYQLLCVYYLQNKIAVFVEYQGPPFEGVKSTGQMIVTGMLN